MAPLTSVIFVAYFTCLWIFVLASGLIKITAEPGQTVTLPCRVPSYTYITTVEWSRTDLWPQWVFFSRGEQSDPTNQHPFFKNRAELKDKQMKDGDAALILKDVIINDTGTYECRVYQDETIRWRTTILDTEPISIISLNVQPDADSDRERFILRIMVFIVVCSPYFVSTLHMVSICRKTSKGNNPSVSMTMSPLNQHDESLDEQNDDVIADTITEHHFYDKV